MHSGEARQADGTTISFDVDGEGPPIVFLHGLTNQRESWNSVTARLASSFSCIRLDFRGHGQSSSASRYDLPSFATDVETIVAELGLDDPVVVGHSLGATVAAFYACGHRTRAVVCVDQTLRFGDFAARIQPLAAELRGERPMEAVVRFEHDLGLEPYPAVPELEQRVRAFDPAVVRGLWAAALDTPPDELTAMSEAILPQVGAPLLSLHGSPPPDDYAGWLSALVPGARVEVWDGMGHLLHLVDPERFAARVIEFLEASVESRDVAL